MYAAASSHQPLVLLLLLLLPAKAAVAPHRAPVVIVPGLGGSTLEARLHRRPDKGGFCETDSEGKWFTIWASLVQGAMRYGCFDENLQLHPAKKAGKGGGDEFPLSNFTGVDIRPRDYGGTGGIEYSNAGASGEPLIAYMHALVKHLKAKGGYVPGASVRGATNDFRVMGVPSALDYEFARLAQLVEDTAAVNGGAKVHLLSHSLGGPVANLFLNEMNAAWKQKFIASHIMLSPVLLGTPVAIYAALTGPRYDYVPQFLPQLVVPLVRTFPSIAWMWPRVSAEGVDVWSGGGDADADAESGEIDFVRTPTQNYSLSNLKALARAVPGADNIVAVWDAMMARTNRSASDPGVPVLCVYANDTLTDLSIATSDTFDEKGKRLAATWGDGTVSLRSLEHCRSWADVEVQPIEFGGSLAAHTEIAQNPEVIDLILAWLLKK